MRWRGACFHNEFMIGADGAAMLPSGCDGPKPSSIAVLHRAAYLDDMTDETAKARPAPAQSSTAPTEPKAEPQERPKEIGGPKGPEPTRYGDWERKGRCIDF
jgi:hypothetical protein